MRKANSRSRQRANVFRSVADEPSISSEVATGSGASSAVNVTLSPRPSTITGVGEATSARIPASLPSLTSTSFGHFRPASTPSAASASATATPVASGNHPQPVRGTDPPATPTDRATCVRGGADHCRPWRPRPALWYSASNTDPSISAPASARASRSALVEPVSATTSSWRHDSPGPTSPSRNVSASSGALSESGSIGTQQRVGAQYTTVQLPWPEVNFILLPTG